MSILKLFAPKIEQQVSRRKSVQFRITVSYLLIIAVSLVLLNTYPLQTLHDSVIRMKQNTSLNQALVIGSALSGLEILSDEDVELVLDQLDTSGLNRIMVTDERGMILHDSSESEDREGDYALLAEVAMALEGRDVFRVDVTKEAVRSRAAVPVMYRGVIIGAVYVYEYDSAQAEMVNSLQYNLWRISFAIVVVSLCVSLVVTRSLTRRIGRLLDGILKYGKTESYQKVDVGGEDEISLLAEEFNNLTDRLNANEEIRRSFVSDASHELKTPLASIRLLSDSILQTEDMDSETMRDFVADIGEEADRLSRMTEKLLALTRLDSKVTAPEQETVDLCYTVDRVLHMLEPLAATKQVALEAEMCENCLVAASGDDLYQIVFNLAENAIKYNVEKGTVRLSLSSEESHVKLSVEDTGIGIPEEEREKIFDRFYRVDKARSREAGGSGLGLSIVRDMVEKYQGTIQVSQRSEGGSVFTVTFPREVSE